MLIIYAHFDRTGHNGEVLRNVESYMWEKDVSYEVLDLYGMGFEPLLHAEDMRARGKSENDPQVREIQEKMLAEREFVFIYPTWWGNVPAMLKGFYDRVFSAGFGFRYNEHGMPEGLLRGRRALVITTTGGPWFFQRVIKVSRALHVSTADVLRFCGFRTRTLLIGNCRKIDDRKREEIRKKVHRALTRFVGG